MASLLALSRACSEDAKHGFLLTVCSHGVGLLFAGAASQTPTPSSHVCAVLALLAELAAWILRYRATRMHHTAEQDPARCHAHVGSRCGDRTSRCRRSTGNLRRLT